MQMTARPYFRPGPVLLLLATLAGLPLGAAGQTAGVPVTVAKPVVRQVTDEDEFIGRFQPVEEVSIRSRVGGYLQEIAFKDGAIVKQGDLLFVIDQRPFETALREAKAALEVANSSLTLAQANFDRSQSLTTSGTESVALLDTRRRDLLAAEANVRGAQASLDRATLDMDYTRIIAPISGRIDRHLLSIGNLVQADQTVLTSIVTLDPIDFYFDVDERRLLSFADTARAQNSSIQQGGGGLKVSVTIADTRSKPFEGKLDFAENRLDSETGTMRMRARFDNPDFVLQPGLFGHILVAASAPYQAILVPDEAIGSDQNERVVYVVGKDGGITTKPVRLGPKLYGYRVIRDGLDGSETLVINGLMRLRPGVKVAPQTVELPPDRPDTAPELRFGGARAMRFSHFFVERPIFASVLSIVLLIVGGIAYFQLPVAQYPEIAPPTIVVRTAYPGADAQTIADVVATPIEEEINGVEGMLYMSSYSTADGAMALTITFKLGTDLDQAQVLVQNRVSIALPRLPEEVQRAGVTTAKSSPDLMMVVHLLSPNDRYDQLYISNYARNRIRDALVRLDGVGDVILFGEREYALRIWLDPDKLASYGMTSGDVVQALRDQNVQVSGGSIGGPPASGTNAFQYTVTTEGRFSNARQFRYVIVKSTASGRLVELQDVARIELGAKDYVTNSYLDGKPAVALGIFARPGTNALDAATAIKKVMADAAQTFPPGLEYRIVYNPTDFIAESISEVYKTIFEAAALVAIVVLVFLQSWRTAIIPIVAIPVSLIGTFALLEAFGLSLNMLTLFGLVLAIGIVVDDAIVVVENVERNLALGMSPREAAHVTMNEVGAAVIAISLVLIAVFVPTAFIPGISGQFYRQFAVTIATCTAISAFNSLTLSPALAGIILKPHSAHETRGNVISRFGRGLAAGFNRGFDRLSAGYAWLVRHLVASRAALAATLVVFAGLIGATWYMGTIVPRGFIPTLDQGYAIVVVQLPDGASLARTDAIIKRASEIVSKTPGVSHAVAFSGFSGATFTNASNSGVIFAAFDEFPARLKNGESANQIIGQLYGRLQSIQEAFIIAIPPPPIRGIGNGGGFKMQLVDTESSDMRRVLGLAYQMMGGAAQQKGLSGVFTTFSASSPQYFLAIDRDKARALNVPIPNIFDTLSINLGTSYVNDFNAFGRVYQVRAQADQAFRMSREAILNLKVRSATGALVPLGTLVEIQDASGPSLVQHYNMYVSVPVQGNPAPRYSSGSALDTMEHLASNILQPGTSYQWTELAYQERNTGNTAIFVFALSVAFVFLALAAQYESWTLPLAIILIVPLAVLAALIGVNLRGMDNNILTQIGLIVLIGLAAKNAILIVEFARQAQDAGKSAVEAAIEASRLRLRPILMTAFAFIFGVVPLMIATGPGAEMRQSLGTAVFSGMLGVTLFGLLLTPVFFVVLRGRRKATSVPDHGTVAKQTE